MLNPRRIVKTEALPSARNTHLHHLILQLGQEPIDNLVLLDGQRVQVYFLHALDLAGLDQPA